MSLIVDRPIFNQLPSDVSNRERFLPYNLLRKMHFCIQRHLHSELTEWLFGIKKFNKLPKDVLHFIASFLFCEPKLSLTQKTANTLCFKDLMW